MPRPLFLMFTTSLLVVLVTTSVSLHCSASIPAVAAFDPLGYHVDTVICPAVDRVLDQSIDITIGEYISAYMRTSTWSHVA